MPSYYTKIHLIKRFRLIILAAGHQCNKLLPKRRWLRRLAVSIIVTFGVIIGGMYGISVWYARTQASKPLELGVSFIPDYAQYLGVDPQETLDSLLAINVKHLRLVSYWDDYELSPGQYDFTQLDWQFKKAEAAHAKVSLAIGLRQPRWPECHMPVWAQSEPASVWQPQLNTYMQKVIDRYKDSPSLQSYQLENEFLLDNFGACTNFDRNRLVSEFNLVSKQDPKHPIIMSRSDNLPLVPLGQPRGGQIGMSIYRRVWDAGVTKRYLTYPFPPWYYSSLAGIEKILTDRDSVVHELQAEAWAPNGQNLKDISLQEQNKTLSAQRLKDSVEFGKATGMRQIDLWGAEYWYYRQQVLHDPTVWNAAKNEFRAN